MQLALVFFVGAHLIHQKTVVTPPPGAQAPPEQVTTLLWDGPFMRTDNGPDMTTIIDYKADKIIMLDHKKKEYSDQKISEVMAQMKAAFDAMRASIAKMPKEQRDAMEGVLGSKSEIKLEPTAEMKKIVGFDSKRYKISQGGRDSGEVWYTKAIDMKDVAPYTKRFSEMTKGMMGASWGDVLAKTENGYPVRSTITLEVMGQKASYTTETTAYEKVKADPAQFQPPKDYKLVAPASKPLK